MENNNNNKSETKDEEGISESEIELKEFSCPQCDKGFETTSKLFIHCRKAHKTPTICHICNKDLKAMPNILSHSYIHKNIKPYKCPNNNCSYQSRTRFNLKVHLGSCSDGIHKYKFKAKARRKKRKFVEDSKTKQMTNKRKRRKLSFPTFVDTNINNRNILDEIPNVSSNINIDPLTDMNDDNKCLILLHQDYIPLHAPVHVTSFMYNENYHSPYNEYIEFNDYNNYNYYNLQQTIDPFPYYLHQIENTDSLYEIPPLPQIDNS